MSKMKWFENESQGVVIVSLGSGDLLLESIRRAAREANLHTGVLMTGIGSLSAGRIHTVATNELPPGEIFLDLPGPLEVISFSGIIANYEPHLHISLMDQAGKCYGGHLEEGCVVLTLSEISILRLSDLRLVRRKGEGDLFRTLYLE
jgi:predicted DNA-binding protein with PD1-like motif